VAFTIEVWRFALVGCIGFAVDAGILIVLLKHSLLPLAISRLISFSSAVSVTWLMNRQFTFRIGSRPIHARECRRYFVVSALGALINYGLFLLIMSAVPRLAPYPVVVLAIAAGVAMLFNFVGSRRYAFSTIND
jgi:putative flippase GtrA